MKEENVVIRSFLLMVTFMFNLRSIILLRLRIFVILTDVHIHIKRGSEQNGIILSCCFSNLVHAVGHRTSYEIYLTPCNMVY